jgi:hypothetical protein
MRGRRSAHEELLHQGARTAPQPETAEERSRRLGLKTGGAAIAGGVAAAAKLGILGKTVLWLIAWHAAVNAWRIGIWAGVAVLVATAIVLAVRARSAADA